MFVARDTHAELIAVGKPRTRRSPAFESTRRHALR
jgi:hypothetical protein